MRRDVRVCLRIKLFVVEAVEHAAVFALMRVQHRLESVTLTVVLRLPRMARRNGRDEIGIDDARLHQVDRMMIGRVAQPVVVSAAPINAAVRMRFIKLPSPSRAPNYQRAPHVQGRAERIRCAQTAEK